MNIYLDYYFSYFILLLYYFVKIKKVYLIHFKKKKKKKKKVWMIVMLSYLRVNMQTTLITDIYIFIITIWNAIINIYHKLTSRDLCDHVILFL